MPSSRSRADGILQRKCACGQRTPGGGECEECRRKRPGILQRAAVRSSAMEPPPAVQGSPGLERDFSRVPLRSGQVLQRRKAAQNPGLGAVSSLSMQAKLQRCEELLKGITTKQEEEALLDLLTTLPFAERSKLVARHGRRRFLRNFGFERRREAEAITLTDADLKDPEILAWLKSRRKPEQYFKYLLHPAVRDHLEKLVRLREISTPLEAQDVKPSGIKDDVKLTVNGIEVVVKRDRKDPGMWKKGSTSTDLFVVPTPGNGPPQVRAEIQTSYGERTDPEDKADYGRGTTEEDKAAGKTSLRFHEGHHGLDALDYLRNFPPPPSQWRSGMTNADYQLELNRYQKDLNDYEKELSDYTELLTDCPGTPHSSARCEQLRR